MERAELIPQHSIPVFCTWQSNRLVYVLDWLFNTVFETTYHLVHDEAELKYVDFFIAYGCNAHQASVSIPNEGLLMQEGVQKKEITTGFWQGIPTLFHKDDEENYSLPFDMFSAIFFLLSRYEEYYPHTQDKHGRYPATASILYQNNWLQRPLIDEWIFAFHSILQSKFPFIKMNPYQYTPTYDIDIAWAYKNKSLKRNVGNVLKDVLQGSLNTLAERINVWQDKKIDPYDCFDWLSTLHKTYNAVPIFFILAALKTTAYDKNNLPNQGKMRSLIKQLSVEGNIGMHPSYFSNEMTVFEAEKNTISTIISDAVTKSRQHYIKLQIPDTYRLLIKQGITDDYSMGYGAVLGFRAATGRSFFWFDILQNETTSLCIHPFCFMDSTAHFENKLSANEAFAQLNAMNKILKKTQSQLITIMHNFSLGTDTQWKGWSDVYRDFIANQYQ